MKTPIFSDAAWQSSALAVGWDEWDSWVPLSPNGLFQPWQLGPNKKHSKRQKQKLQISLSPASDTAQHHFCCILLLKTSPRANWEPRGGEQNHLSVGSVTKSSRPSSLYHNGRHPHRLLEIPEKSFIWGQCLTLEKGSKSQWSWIISIVVNWPAASKAWEKWNDSKATSVHFFSPLLYPNCWNEACITSPVPITHIHARP